MEHGDLRTLLIDCAEKNVTLSMYEQLVSSRGVPDLTDIR